MCLADVESNDVRLPDRFALRADANFEDQGLDLPCGLLVELHP
jgi:hypothetical protein